MKPMKLKNHLAAAILVVSAIWATPTGVLHIAKSEPVLDIQKRDLICLAENIYHESRGEPFWGKVAVAQVTLNRVKHPTQFNSTVCGVVHARNQFSWTLDKQKRIKDKDAWREAVTIATAVANGTLWIKDFSALYFHTHQVKPRWRKQFSVVATIGNHVFYS